MPDSPQFEVLPNGVTMVTRPDGGTYAVRTFDWSPDSVQAAMDVAEGIVSLREIADRAGISRMLLNTWRQHPEFIAKVDEHKQALRAMVLQYGIAQTVTRMAHLQSRHDAIRQCVTERGQQMAEKYPDLPGASTGYIYLKPSPYGDMACIDGKTAQLLADMEKQAAIAMGEWNEGDKPAVSVQIVVPSGAPPAASVPTIDIGTRQI